MSYYSDVEPFLCRYFSIALSMLLIASLYFLSLLLDVVYSFLFEIRLYHRYSVWVYFSSNGMASSHERVLITVDLSEIMKLINILGLKQKLKRLSKSLM